jgi:hypothetical protein
MRLGRPVSRLAQKTCDVIQLLTVNCKVNTRCPFGNVYYTLYNALDDLVQRKTQFSAGMFGSLARVVNLS